MRDLVLHAYEYFLKNANSSSFSRWMNIIFLSKTRKLKRAWQKFIFPAPARWWGMKRGERQALVPTCATMFPECSTVFQIPTLVPFWSMDPRDTALPFSLFICRSRGCLTRPINTNAESPFFPSPLLCLAIFPSQHVSFGELVHSGIFPRFSLEKWRSVDSHASKHPLWTNVATSLTKTR